jgi:hypothetical protein
MKTQHATFRLDPNTISWIKETAKKHKVSQAEVLGKCVEEARSHEGRIIASQVMDKGGSVTPDDEVVQMLTALGVATASGFAGYYISGFIREQLQMDEDKGTQMLIGVLAGLGTLMIQAYHQQKK